MPGHADIARLLPGRRLPSIAVRAFEDRGAGELGAAAIVARINGATWRLADNTDGFAVNPDHRGQFPRNARAREAGIGNQRQILTGAVIVDGQNAELARRAEGVRPTALSTDLCPIP